MRGVAVNAARWRRLIPAAVGLATIGALVAFGDPRRVAALLWHLNPRWLVAGAGLLLLAVLLRTAQWFWLSRALAITTATRHLLPALLTGQVARSVPGGAVFQALVVGAEVADLRAVTSVSLTVLLTEIGVALVGALILDASGCPWLRPAATGFVAGGAMALVLVRSTGRLPRLDAFARHLRCLWQPRVILPNAALAAANLAAAGLALGAVLAGLGAPIDVPGVVGAYLLGVAAYLLVPVPLDVGGPEIATTAALLAIGVDRGTAVSAVLLLRMLGLGASLVAAAGGALAQRAAIRLGG